MNNTPSHKLLHRITPLTQAILWLPENRLWESCSSFSSLNYLFDGLLKQNLSQKKQNGDVTSLFAGENFGKKIYLFIISPDFKRPENNIKLQKETQSFMELLSRELNSESDIVLLDYQNNFKDLETYFQAIVTYIRRMVISLE